MSQTVTAAVAQRDNGAQALIAKYRTDFAQVLPSHLRPTTFVRLSQGLLRRNVKLAEAAERNPASFLAALLECARLGHDPGTDQFALVPFNDRKRNTVEVVGIEQYQGVIERMYRAGAVRSVKAEVVRAADPFEYAPDVMDRPGHKPNWFADRGELIGVYAYAEFFDGSTSRVVMMNRETVMAHKAKSRGATSEDSPWQAWEESMWLKTAVHELEKWVPTSSEDRRAARDGTADPAPVEVPRVADEVLDADLVEDDHADHPTATPTGDVR
ncbi:recombinase RecT [Actinocrispum wychmicini]|uniref:Recombination protein RecT n=1 Tax=Actinocrispum wychmicini TaxID=1213861 RepID=A0A4R2JYN0_9PSEU|nr:recombinase RecT [Actinocrispum wychmicini]TCO64362.1 recombination protein RecT [Actinocrispum wychmicini]